MYLCIYGYVYIYIYIYIYIYNIYIYIYIYMQWLSALNIFQQLCWSPVGSVGWDLYLQKLNY